MLFDMSKMAAYGVSDILFESSIFTQHSKLTIDVKILIVVANC